MNGVPISLPACTSWRMNISFQRVNCDRRGYPIHCLSAAQHSPTLLQARMRGAPGNPVGFRRRIYRLRARCGRPRAFLDESGSKKVEAIFGPKYQVATIWLPPSQHYIAMESLTALIDGLNLARQGKYPALQTVPPGGKWTESFWIRASGI